MEEMHVVQVVEVGQFISQFLDVKTWLLSSEVTFTLKISSSDGHFLFSRQL